MKINTFYMVVMVQEKDYQRVTKNQGTKRFPPLSSCVLLILTEGSPLGLFTTVALLFTTAGLLWPCLAQVIVIYVIHKL